MSYDINILVNGNRCKQFSYEGKLYIEAKHGSEYVIEIKNHTWQRILAVCSVDGLDVLTGKKASENAAGYVINGFNNVKLDGFRVSNDKVAKFVFGAKSDSYAASKEDGSENNVGVIAVRLFQEKIKPPTEIHHHHHHDHWPEPVKPWKPWTWPYGTSTGDPPPPPTTTIWCDIPPAAKTPLRGHVKTSAYSCKIENAALNMPIRKRGFDMGTQWGEAKESRVYEVEFEKGFLALTTNIYYASRQSLIEMGIPLGNEKQVSFPEPFPADSKYAKPPKNWRG